MKALEIELDQSALQKQLEQLQKQLELLDEEKKDTQERLQQEVKKCSDLESIRKHTSCNLGNIISCLNCISIIRAWLMIRCTSFTASSNRDTLKITKKLRLNCDLN